MAGRLAVSFGNEEYFEFASGGRPAGQVTMLTAPASLRLMAARYCTRDGNTPRTCVGQASNSLAEGQLGIKIIFVPATTTPKERGS